MGLINSFPGGNGGNSVEPYTSNPAMNGTASAGSSDNYARGDHVHPSDTAKLGTSGDGSNVTAAFTAASSRANISTGEKLSVIFGKIAKFFADLKTVAFSGSYNDLSNKLTAGNNISISAQNVITANASGSLVNNYTTSEQVIGTWVNGETLYQRVVTVPLVNAASTSAWISGHSANISVKNYGGCILYDTNPKESYQLGGSVWYETKNEPDVSVSSDGSKLVFHCKTDWTGYTAYVITQYTKTTD